MQAAPTKVVKSIRSFTRTFTVALLCSGLAYAVTQLLAPPAIGKPDASLKWLATHYPTLMASSDVQQAYDSLIQGYFVPQTGLFLSFADTSDRALVQQGATYDQGIVGVLLIALGDLENAGKLVRFYERAWERLENRTGPRQGRQGLANFYNAYFECEGIEKTMHVGPNAWIGLMASRYYHETRDRQALQLAENIARWILYRVPHSEGVVAMGEIGWNSTPWDRIYSTENNESTYAFLTDLRRAKDIPEGLRQDINMECYRIKRWLLQKAYDPKTGKVLRGFHPAGRDRVGAIDSYTWFIGTLRPQTLRAEGIRPDRLMDLATRDFVVKVGNRSGVDPVDGPMAEATYKDDYFNRRIKDPLYLRPQEERHPVIWYEGTGQYLVALQDVAADYVREAFRYPAGPDRQKRLAKAQQWIGKARQGLQWMDEAAIVKPWGKTYPCATDGRFYLYGWPAPRGNEHQPADAVAALVWRLFAGIGYEPLSGTYLNPAARPQITYRKKIKHDPGTDILYGASEEMVVKAWDLFDAKRYDYAWRQAQATIDLWEKDARALQKKKQSQERGYIAYDGESMAQFQKVHDYWALNDVCAAYFIQGQIAHQRQAFPLALEKFSYILKEFPLAQMWDKRGWFWNPVDTLQMDFAAADPAHYGALFDLLPDPNAPPLTESSKRL